MSTPAVIKIIELPGRTGSGQIQPGQTTGDEVRKYQVFFDGPDATSDMAKEATVTTGGVTTAVPAYWTAISGGATKMLLQKSAEQLTTDPTIWIVTCTYSIPQAGQSQQGTAAKWNCQISGHSVVHSEAIKSDMQSPPKPIVNKAGEAISGITADIYDEEITVSYDTYEPDWATLDACRGKSNIAAVTLNINGHVRTFAIHTLRLKATEWSATVDKTGAGAVKVTLHFFYRADTWTVVVPNMGYNQLDGSGNLVPILNNATDKQPRTTPSYLDSSGHVQSPTTAVVFLSFENVVKVSFTTLLTDVGT